MLRENAPFRIVGFFGVVLGAAVILAACVSQRTGIAPPNDAETVSSFVRRIAPFEVRDETGTPYDHPFLGGLNVPRPQFADIDNDGDLDLFVQETTGQVMFFEQVGTPTRPRFVWRTDQYQDIDVGEWYRLYDVDADGDVDLLAERKFSYIQYYRNDGSPEVAAFTLVADTLRDVEGNPLFADRQNIPSLTDIDCNDRLDLFIGRVTGIVLRYETAGTDANGIPRFKLLSERFENIEIIGQIGTLHGANTLAFGDTDRDGDPDLFWGDFFEPGLLFIENTGACHTPMLQNEPIPFPLDNPLSTSGYNAPVFADLDQDQDEDLFVGVLGGAFNPTLTAMDNFYFLEADSVGFTLRTQRFLSGIDVGTESIPTFADLDTDGDLDMLVANKIDANDLKTSRVYLYKNRGTPSQPSFQLEGHLPLEPSFHFAPAPGDLDADGDLDMLIGTWNQGVALYRNEGTPTAPHFVAENPSYVQLTRGSNSAPALVDIDADGDLDLFVGEASGTLNFYRNDGTPQTPRFTLVSDEYGDIDIGRRSHPAFVDLDADGDQDLVVGTEAGSLVYFRNDGTPHEPDFVRDDTFALPVQQLATPAFADIDGDGDADFFAGGISGGVRFYEHRPNTR
ncbi:MAG: FG-GAP repeat domain-containing protein [Rhodothermales bacterium]